MNSNRKVRSAAVRVTEGSGNVFADLGVAHPERELIKAELALQIYRIIRARGLSQKQVGKILGISQPQVSVVARNRGAERYRWRKASAKTHSPFLRQGRQECLCHRGKATRAALKRAATFKSKGETR